MQMDRWTIKAQEALQGAQHIAQRLSHQEIDGEHLLLSLLEQPEGLVQPLFQSLGVPPAALGGALDEELARRPKVQGAQDTFIGADLKRALQAAQTAASKLKDDYTSTEHLLLGLIDQGGPSLKRLFQKHGVRQDQVLQALAELRGHQRVTDPNPEDKFQALEKYG